jgi:hypothetical protein
MFGGITVGSILLVFYLYLLVREEHVKRPMLLLLGCTGILLGIIAGFFQGLRDPVTAMSILQSAGALMAFVCAVGACYGGELPVKLPGTLDGSTASKEPGEAE